MILLDANVLIYAYDQSSPHHGSAKRWLEATLNEDDEIAIGLVTILAFLRVMTNPNLFDPPLTVAEGVEIVGEWLSRPNVGIAQPTSRHLGLLAELARTGKVRGAALMDAHLAALALEHGATLCTTDRDIARFPGIGLEDPVAV